MAHNGQWVDGDEPIGEYFDKNGEPLEEEYPIDYTTHDDWVEE